MTITWLDLLAWTGIAIFWTLLAVYLLPRRMRSRWGDDLPRREVIGIAMHRMLIPIVWAFPAYMLYVLVS
jgi:hypothetical protein